jgi:hypothetical protein
MRSMEITHKTFFKLGVMQVQNIKILVHMPVGIVVMLH